MVELYMRIRGFTIYLSTQITLHKHSFIFTMQRKLNHHSQPAFTVAVLSRRLRSGRGVCCRCWRLPQLSGSSRTPSRPQCPCPAPPSPWTRPRSRSVCRTAGTAWWAASSTSPSPARDAATATSPMCSTTASSSTSACRSWTAKEM